MNDSVFCSFICPVYNREKYIKKAIDSVLSQTVQDFELVIVNDGSTDNSDKIISSYNSDKIKYIKTEHLGCWKAKNYAISQAKGRFLCFIDSDDFISDNYLETAIQLIQLNSSYDYFYPTLMKIVTEDENPTDTIWRYIDYPPSQRQQLIKLFWEHQIGGIPHAGAFIKKSVFDKVGFYNDDFFNLSDTDFIVRNALKIKFFLLPELLSYYNRQHTAQTNSNYNERFRTYSETLDYIIKNYPSESFIGKDLKKNSLEFLNLCVEKFMSLAQKSNNNIYFIEKAKKYLNLLRQAEK
ncbi:MAG: glycosyltransferase [Candidatus Cloacimonetes bacterium]|nr:glycosyltransferase [Candidatus Cloacimonadota bacterium]